MLAILLNFSLMAVHMTMVMGGAGWLSYRAEDLKVLKQAGVCGVGARNAGRKMKVSLAWHKAGFNHAQQHLPLKQVGAVCLRGAHIPMAVQALLRSQCSAEEDVAYHWQLVTTDGAVTVLPVINLHA